METSKENPHHEKLIEDYLISGYRPDTCENTTDSDQQFAKPIEDEDMFGTLDSNTYQADTNTQSKRKQWHKLKDLTKLPAPRKFAADCDEDGMIGIGDIEIPQAEPEIGSTAKEIFNKAALRRVKDKYGLYMGQKLLWDRYNDYLRKKISSDKRKLWDSLHGSLDKYDDEEELIAGRGREEDDLCKQGHDDDGDQGDECPMSEDDGDADDPMNGEELIEEENIDEHVADEEDVADEEADEKASDEGRPDNDHDIAGGTASESTCRMRSKWIDDDDDGDSDGNQGDDDSSISESNQDEEDGDEGEEDECDEDSEQDNVGYEKVGKCDSIDDLIQRSPRSDNEEVNHEKRVYRSSISEDEFESESDFGSDSNSNQVD